MSFALQGVAAAGFWRRPQACGAGTFAPVQLLKAALLLSAVAVPLPTIAWHRQASSPLSFGLEGEWRFLLDREDRGLRDRVWQTRLPDRITLPGTTDTGGFGDPVENGIAVRTRIRSYVGPAWYQREITIPYGWRRRRITLFLERCHWETRLWVDGTYVGMRDSLSVPHVYDITDYVSPGTHRLAIRVDNRRKYDLGWNTSAVSDAVQGNWNGIVGRIELRSSARVWLEDVQCMPDLARRTVQVRTSIGSRVGRTVRITVRHTLLQLPSEWVITSATVKGAVDGGSGEIDGSLVVPVSVPLWEPDAPVTYVVRTELTSTDGRTTWLSRSETPCPLRQLRAADSRLFLNNRPLLLRGAVDRGVFPLTGYPPSSAAFWDRFFMRVRSFGVNHIRFHTWCPPEAAFQAADARGMLLLVELPASVTNVGRVTGRDTYLAEEARRILQTYGNHPSFVMLSLGSGLLGDQQYLTNLIRGLRRADRRRLYAASSAGVATGADDFAVVPIPAGQVPTERSNTARSALPVIAHEVGPASPVPDIAETSSSRGVTRPSLALAYQKRLENAGLVGKAQAFARAASLTALEQVKANVERLLATGALAGYHLDAFLGGETLTGAGSGPLNALREESGLIGAQDMRSWCNDTVLLCSLARRIFSTADALDAEVSIAHYGRTSLDGEKVIWKLKNPSGVALREGTLSVAGVSPGTVATIGRISCPLNSVKPPACLMLSLELASGGIRNEWRVWVFSTEDEGPFAEGVYVTSRLSETALERLRQGGNVLLLDNGAALRKSISARLAPVAPGVTGLLASILCETNHAALRDFPADAWAGPPWYDMLARSRCLALLPGRDPAGIIVHGVGTSAGYGPLALLYECRVGKGKLMICTLDLVSSMSERHEARQLLRSLLGYVSSDAFHPVTAIDEVALRHLVWTSSEGAARDKAPDLEKASLWVRAGAFKTDSSMTPWDRSSDIVVARREGLSYSVEGEAGSTAEGGFWSAPERLIIRLEGASSGEVLLRMRCSLEKSEYAQLYLSTNWFQTVPVPAGRAVWTLLPLQPSDIAAGKVEVSIESEGAPVYITDLVFIAREASSETSSGKE